MIKLNNRQIKVIANQIADDLNNQRLEKGNAIAESCRNTITEFVETNYHKRLTSYTTNIDAKAICKDLFNIDLSCSRDIQSVSINSNKDKIIDDILIQIKNKFKPIYNLNRIEDKIIMNTLNSEDTESLLQNVKQSFLTYYGL